MNIRPEKLHRVQLSTPAALKRPKLRRVVILQGLVAVMLTVISFMLAGYEAALAALSGCIVCLVPSLYFAWRMFRVKSGYAHITRSLYTAGAGKFGLTVALFSLVFATVPPSNPTLFFCAYVATSFVHWLAPWLLRGGLFPRT